ncbi:MAG TPA: hypothetical protein PK843_06875 [bacterium]|nr:hypothetical protein [bacterium]
MAQAAGSAVRLIGVNAGQLFQLQPESAAQHGTFPTRQQAALLHCEEKTQLDKRYNRQDIPHAPMPLKLFFCLKSENGERCSGKIYFAANDKV